MDKKLDYKALIEEYNNVVNEISIEDIENENKVLNTDIELLERDIVNLDGRINGIEKEKEELRATISNYQYAENIQIIKETMQEAIEKAINEKQASIDEIVALKEKKEEELRKKQEQKLENETKVAKAQNIGKELIQRAKFKTIQLNKEIDKEIKKLEKRKDKFGIVLEKDENGNVQKKQLTSEEKLVVENIEKKIEALKKQKKVNVKKLESFKKMINTSKEKNKAEPTVAEPTVTEPTVAEPTVTEPTVAEPTVTEPTVAEPTVAEPTVAEPTVTEPTVAEPTVAEPTPTDNKIKSIYITAGKYTINFGGLNSITYSNDENDDRNLDMYFDRKSEQEYRKLIEAKYPIASMNCIKKLDLGLVKILDEINPELCNTYIKSVRDGISKDGLPVIEYFEDINDKKMTRESFVTRRNAINNSAIANNNINRNFTTKVYDFIQQRGDSIANWWDEKVKPILSLGKGKDEEREENTGSGNENISESKEKSYRTSIEEPEAAKAVIEVGREHDKETMSAGERAQRNAEPIIINPNFERDDDK